MNLKDHLNNDSVKSKTINKIADIAIRENVAIYIVGGYIRDLIIFKKEPVEVDISVIGDAVKLAEIVAGEFDLKLAAVYKRFGTALLTIKNNNIDFKIEFASARKESYDPDSRKPIVNFSNLDDDLSRRDFTINALAVPLFGNQKYNVIDLFDGLTDLDNKMIRTPLDPKKTFNDDPLRILRAARFASKLHFKVHRDTLKAMEEMRERLKPGKVVSQERITDEFLKTLKTSKPSIGLTILQKTKVMEVILPEVSRLEGIDQRKDYHHKDVFYHTMQVLDNISKKTDDVWLRYTALMHDIAKPPTKKFVEGIGWTFHGHEDLGAKWQKNIFNRMKLPMEKLPYVEKLIRLHLRPIALAEHNVTDSAVRRLIFEAGDDINDLMILCRADITSKDPKKVKEFTGNFDRVEKRMKDVEERDKIRNFKSPVDGIEIMKICGLQPGPRVGELKNKIEEAILEGIIPNEYDAALEYLLKIKDE